MSKAIVYNKVPNCKNYNFNIKENLPECKKFEYISNGKKHYEFTYIVREKEYLCGIYGTYYVPKKDIFNENYKKMIQSMEKRANIN